MKMISFWFMFFLSLSGLLPMKNSARSNGHPPAAGEERALSRKAAFGLRLRAGALLRAFAWESNPFIHERIYSSRDESADAQDVFSDCINAAGLIQILNAITRRAL
jgi:hypothetical protein